MTVNQQAIDHQPVIDHQQAAAIAKAADPKAPALMARSPTADDPMAAVAALRRRHGTLAGRPDEFELGGRSWTLANEVPDA